MAEQSDRLAKNKAFLQQQECLRMSKPSSLAIDLRNKVIGECQTYHFGGVTHYLDDRGYLLAKRLMERFDGRYTISVYELVLKAIKTLAQTDSTLPSIKTAQSVLNRENGHIQLLHFDKLFQHEALHILYTTQLEIHFNDIMYHATTIDISSTVIRIVLKRAYTLSKEDIVLISYTELAPASDPELLVKIPHEIVKIDHNDQRTHIILKRVDDNVAVTAWFTDWTGQHQILSRLDIEHQLLNTVHEFYLRLYLQKTKKPLIWLSKLNFPDPIKAIHLNPESRKIIAELLDTKGNLNLSLLPSQQVITEQRDYLAIISIENEVTSSIVIPCQDKIRVALALSHPFEQVLLLQSHAMSFSNADFK